MTYIPDDDGPNTLRAAGNPGTESSKTKRGVPVFEVVPETSTLTDTMVRKFVAEDGVSEMHSYIKV